MRLCQTEKCIRSHVDALLYALAQKLPAVAGCRMLQCGAVNPDSPHNWDTRQCFTLYYSMALLDLTRHRSMQVDPISVRTLCDLRKPGPEGAR